jgi:hypothetical protein
VLHWGGPAYDFIFVPQDVIVVMLRFLNSTPCTMREVLRSEVSSHSSVEYSLLYNCVKDIPYRVAGFRYSRADCHGATSNLIKQRCIRSSKCLEPVQNKKKYGESICYH